MAEFKVIDHGDRAFSEVQVLGELQAGELSAFTRSEQFSGLRTSSLWDYRGASWAKAPTAKLIEGFESSRNLVPADMKIACVYGDAVDFGVGRMFQGKAEFEGINNEFEVFRDIDEAMAWLLSD